MGFVVVRCPGCRGASRVGPEAVGVLVVCPRCSDPFLAVEEAEPAAPARPVARVVARPSPRRPDRDEPPAPPPTPAGPDPHDPFAVEAGGLPLSVMIGLALLPFAIPLVWLIAPLAAGPPALSIATPAALAVAAAALCLAVVFTVDWTPSTRLKGVVVLVGLAYLAGLSLYFVKREMADWVQRAFAPGQRVVPFTAPDGSFRVDLPATPRASPAARPLDKWPLTCFEAARPVPGVAGGVLTCVVGSGPDPAGAAADDDWFNQAKAAVIRGSNNGQVVGDGQRVEQGVHPGREWRVRVGVGTVRTVRVYRAPGRAFYLSAEGPDAGRFGDQMFESFTIAE